MEQESAAKGNSSETCSQSEENGFADADSFRMLNSENVVQEYLLQPPIRAIDDHLVEFSEALRSKTIVYKSFCFISVKVLFHL